MERNIKLIVAYDGTAYHGFQRQLNALAIQQILEEKLAAIFGHSLKINGAARTDSGVHAYGQVVNFYTTGTIPTERIIAAAKGILPSDIVVQTAEEMPPEFHSRFAAKSKIYIYRAYYGAVADPFLLRYAWQLPRPVDSETMNKAMNFLIGEHDFSAFRGAGGPSVDPVRTILAATCQSKRKIIEFEFWGTGFLYHMVRNIVGTVFAVGCGKLAVDDLKLILESKDRTKAGITAPPQGLYLKKIFY